MTNQQPNAFCAGLRKALDIVRDQDELRANVAAMLPRSEQHAYRCAAHYLANVLDAIADQLVDAGGFLGDAPEPEERVTVRSWTVCVPPVDSDVEQTGWFEYDKDGTGGGLWFENGELVDYDGVSCIPAAVVEGIRQLGFTVPADME